MGRAHGLDMTAWRVDADELIGLDRPGIAWWTYNHWIVMCGRDENGNVVIANPSRGRYAIDPESFRVSYAGVALFNGSPMDLPEGWAVDENIPRDGLFLHQDKVWQALEAIPKGGLARPGRNCVKTTLNDIR